MRPNVHKIFFQVSCYLVLYKCRNELLGSRPFVVSLVFVCKKKLCPSQWCGQRKKNKPFKFGNDKILSSVFPGSFRNSSVCRDGVLVTKDAVLQSKVSKYLKQQRKEAKLALALHFYSNNEEQLLHRVSSPSCCLGLQVPSNPVKVMLRFKLW